ncbi:MAG TPA: hypothetical protein VMW31_00855, partial [Devosiaceae bacterium]|nr:hypothetical protein [Devosiaceae bacterium]
ARSADHNAVSLSVPTADAGRIKGILKTLKDVASVSSEGEADGASRLLIRPAGGRYIADVVAKAVREHNVVATDLHAVPARLDDVFRTVTTGSDG